MLPSDKFDLVIRKAVFPYDYIDSPAKFNELKLPAPECFYNKLSDCKISKEDYNHAIRVLNDLNIKSIGEYSDFYVTLDVTLLCDIMEQFRFTCIEAYGLDPLHSYTSPGLAWQAMLKETKCKLELLTDVDMILLVENGVRGGLVQSVTKYYDQSINKKVLGKTKDETNGVPICEMVSLMSKMYAIKLLTDASDENNTIKKAKGIKTLYVKKKYLF